MANLLDGIINTIFGPDTSAMSTQDRATTEKSRTIDRNNAQSQAFNAMNDQGQSYIDGSQAVKASDSSSNLLESIGKVLKFL